jgi:ribosome biogenesis GTPase
VGTKGEGQLSHAGRVLSRHGRHYTVSPDDSPASAVDAVSRGRNIHAVAGDLVLLEGAGPSLQVTEVLERRSLLHREDGDRSKPLAANIDQVVVVFAPRPPFQRALLWRSLIAARVAGLDCLVVRNKSDIEDTQADAALEELSRLGARTVRVAVRTDPAGARASLLPLLEGRASVLVGQSGVGKSSLLNLLLGSSERTGELSRGERGKQTTTSARWFALGAQGAIVDSPGFQAFGLDHVAASQLALAMDDLAGVQGSCRFLDCLHREEPGCRIRAALARGELDPARYAFYLELLAHLLARAQELRRAPRRG